MYQYGMLLETGAINIDGCTISMKLIDVYTKLNN